MTDELIDVQEIGDALLIVIQRSKLLDDSMIKRLGEALLANARPGSVIIDFQRVSFMSSAMNGQLVKLNNLMFKLGGRLVFCGLNQACLQVWKIMKIAHIFETYRDAQQALQRVGELVYFLACPLTQCRSGTFTDNASLEAETHFACPSCDTQFTVCGSPESGDQVEAIRLRIRTYEHEDITVCAPHREESSEERYYILQITGRFDLFVADVFSKVLDILPHPRQLVVDFTSTTKVTDVGMEELTIAVEKKNAAAVVVGGEESFKRRALSVPR